MPESAACIDITGSSRTMDIAFCRDGQLHLSTMVDVQHFCDWVENNNPRIIAVDGPSKHNCGRVAQTRMHYGIPNERYEDFRVVEALLRLRGIGLYNTPAENPPTWMKRGWALYQSLENLGFGLLDQPGRTVIAAGEKKVIEVHPHASFVVGLGWIPKTKQALAGQLERMAYLRVECAQLNINVTGTFLADDPLAMLLRLETTWDSVLTGGLDLPRISHDQLDAVAGLTTAIRAANGQAFAVGDTADGVIVVPAELAQLPYRGR